MLSEFGFKKNRQSTVFNTMEVQYSFFLLLCTQRVYNLRLYVVYGKIQKERKRKEKVQRMDGQFINKKSACKHKYMAIQFTQTIKEIATFYFHISVGECVSFFSMFYGLNGSWRITWCICIRFDGSIECVAPADSKYPSKLPLLFFPLFFAVHTEIFFVCLATE